MYQLSALLSVTMNMKHLVCGCRSMPSSYKGTLGKIVYDIEAKITRSWMMNKTDSKHLIFVSKASHNVGYLMVCKH